MHRVYFLIWLWVPVCLHAETAISSFSDNRNDYGGTVPLYEKFEVTFDITGSPATNTGFPYDIATPSHLPARIGITVDGLFLPPQESDWSRAIIQPAFYYQPMIDDTSIDGSWIHPEGQAVWKVRFAPRQTGTWSYKIRVQDDGITSGGANMNAWLESDVYTFRVGSARPGNHGFVEVSPHDRRYFRMSDGTFFAGLGHQSSSDNLKEGLENIREMGQYGIDFVRMWMSASLIVGRGTHSWDPWRAPDGSSVHPEMRVWYNDGVTGVPYGNHDFAVKLEWGNNSYIYRVSCCTQDLNGAFKANTTYKIKIRAKLVGVNAAGGVSPRGLVLKIIDDPANFSGSTVVNLTTQDITGTADWQVYEATWRNTLGKTVFPWGRFLALGLQNVSGGTVYIDEVYIGEDLGDGKIGACVLPKANVNYHYYIDQIPSYMWDRVFEAAKQAGVYLRPVILEKDDDIYRAVPNDDFFSAPGKKVRRLHEYFWRYLAARWGYCTAIHSWELSNESPWPNEELDDLPWEQQTSAFADFIHQWDRNHMASNSWWCCWSPSFWDTTSADFADVHAYISTVDMSTDEEEMQMERDAAYYHIWASTYARNLGLNKPWVRGEGGMDSRTQQDENILGIQRDNTGVWLHNFLWAGLHSGGLYEQYWWTEHFVRPGVDFRNEFKRVRDFLEELQLENGGYEDWAGTCSNNNIRVVGQKNIAKNVFHLWIQNKHHTWRNVVDGVSIAAQSGTVSLGGFTPNTAIELERWNTWTGRVENTETMRADGSGKITITVSDLRTDFALRAVPPAMSTNSKGSPAVAVYDPVVRLRPDGVLMVWAMSATPLPVNVALYSLDGRKLADVRAMLSGREPIAIGANGLSQGTYLVTVNAGPISKTTRMFKVK